MDPVRWQRIRAVVEEALDLAPADRAARLDRANLTPAERRDVEALLGHHDSGWGFLERAAEAATSLLPAEPLAPGQLLGDYRVTREIGRGGMGVVYEARDERLGRDVAVKVLPPALAADPRRRARLEREARAAAAVRHPGIGHVYALGEDGDGLVYVVSELVTGQTLREELAAGPLDPRVALDTARQIAGALAAAHARGVIHRDLKPENVMRATDGTVKVLDFGLARFSDDPTAARLTVAGEVMGTPGYMAPEQLRGEDSGAAIDVFAFGVLMREMLAGRPAAPAPGLASIIEGCTAAAPRERYATMAEVVAALEKVSAAPARPDAALTWWQLHQAIVSVLYISMIVPAWLVRGPEVPALVRNRLVLAVVLMAASVATIRLHWVFIARVHPGQVAEVRARALPWLRVFDWGMTAVLLAAAVVAFNGDRVWHAAVFLTVAVSARLTAWFIEPATTRAAMAGAHE